MKLLTLNCHSWQEKDQLYKIKYLAKVIKEKQYDVITFQEVSQGLNSKIIKDNVKEKNYLEVLVSELEKLGEYNYSYIWDFSHIGYDIYEEGIGILTNKRVINKEGFYISKTDEITNYKSRKILKATIEINNRNYDFYSCHLGWWNDEDEPFKYQADELIKSISKERLSFIMGDFNNNALIRNEGYDYLISKGVLDTYNEAEVKDSGITVGGEIDGWKNQTEEKRLDLILSNKPCSVKSSNIIFNGNNEEIISDHFGVEVEIVV